jgi:hypothetical protein
MVQNWKQEKVHPHSVDSDDLFRDTWVSPWRIENCTRPLRRSCASANTVYSRAERVFVLERSSTSKSFAVAVRAAFSSAYSDKGVPSKTVIHRLVTTFRDTGSVCVCDRWTSSDRTAEITAVTTWNMGRLAQSVQCLTTDWMTGVRSPTGAQDFSSNLCVQTDSKCPPSFLHSGYRGLFDRG